MVYVDKLFDNTPFNKGNFPTTQSCHMVADTLEELIDFGIKMGLKEHWIHWSPTAPHFDLTPNKRAKAVQMGAIERESIVDA